MYSLENDKLLFSLSPAGEITHLVNKASGRNIISTPRVFWKLIYRTTSDQEFPIFAENQVPNIDAADQQMSVSYRMLRDGSLVHDIDLTFQFKISDDEVIACASLTNNADLEVVELWFPHIAGITALGCDPDQDVLYWPAGIGTRVFNPLKADFLAINGNRIYEMQDHLHRDLFLPYPGSASMQWFELANDEQGLYLASYDKSFQSTCLNAQQDTKSATLGLGFIKYPMAKKGEQFSSAPFVISPHAGDWHTGARKYRAWADGWWTPPRIPDWMQDFTGWIRVILRHQYGEVLRDYASLPALYEASAAYGIDTVYILGWIPSGFARMWPEYVPDPALGGESGLREAIERIHSKGGRLMMFISGYLIDRQTDYYKQVGHRITIKTFWGGHVGLPETYTGEGTWRRIMMGSLPLIGVCPATPEWQELMADTGERLAGYGADGILYDIGSPPPWLCYGEGHAHPKPSLSAAGRVPTYQKSRAAIKQANPDAVIAIELPVDAFCQFADLVHPAYIGTFPHPRAFPELYRYTFPEQIFTNRECSQDENDYLTNANFTFTHGLRFDMTIYRCRGTLEDIPNYAAYLKTLNRLRITYAHLLLRGRFADTDGLRLNNPHLIAKVYLGKDEAAVVLWNASSSLQAFSLDLSGYHLQKFVTVEDEHAQLNELEPNQVAVALYRLATPG